MIKHSLQLQFRMNDIEVNKTLNENCKEADENVQIEARKQEDIYAK